MRSTACRVVYIPAVYAVALVLLSGCDPPCLAQVKLPAQVPYDDQVGPLRPAIAPTDALPSIAEIALARAAELPAPARSYSPAVARALHRVVAQIDAQRVTDWRTLREAMAREMGPAIPPAHRNAWRSVFGDLAPRTRVDQFRQARDRIEELAVGFGKVCTTGMCPRGIIP